jgi:hypothetical protein
MEVTGTGMAPPRPTAISGGIANPSIASVRRRPDQPAWPQNIGNLYAVIPSSNGGFDFCIRDQPNYDWRHFTAPAAGSVLQARHSYFHSEKGCRSPRAIMHENSVEASDFAVEELKEFGSRAALRQQNISRPFAPVNRVTTIQRMVLGESDDTTFAPTKEHLHVLRQC